MVQVIEGQIQQKQSEGKQKLLPVSRGGLSYRGPELPRVKLH